MAEHETRVEPADWDQAIAAIDGPQIVVGGPGTGKTEFLVRRAVFLMDELGIDPSAILVLGFSRRGVAELRHRIDERLDSPATSIHATTFHSFAAHLLELHGAEHLGWRTMPTLLTGPEQVALVRSLLEHEDTTAWAPEVADVVKTGTFAREATDFLLRCQEQLITPADVTRGAAAQPLWRAMGGFYDRYLTALSESGRIDYGTLMATAVTVLAHQDVQHATGDQFRHVLVDEFQDTTAAQATLLERIVAPHRNLTAAADPYQSIYSFRGADLGNVAAFPTRFASIDGQPGRRIVLTTSFRVSRHILAAADRVAGPDLPGAAGPVTPTSTAGSVDVYRFEQETEEAEWIASEIDRLRLTEGISYSDMAVFVRSKRRFLPELSRALERRHIPHDPPDSRLADHPAVRFVLDCVIAATDPDRSEVGRAIRRILLGPLFATTLGRLREIETQRRRDPSWSVTLRDAGIGAGALADLLDDPAWARQAPAVSGFWKLWTSLPQIRDVVTDPDRAGERTAWTSLGQVLSRLNERNPTATLDDYRQLVEDTEFEAQPLLSYRRPGGEHLTVTTLHQSKGLEFEVVFIADAVEGTFPDLRTRDSLMGIRHLSPHLPAEPLEYLRFRLQEERRLAYTAMVRARSRVVWTATASGFSEGDGIPSRFLALVAGREDGTIAGRPQRRPPVTPAEAEAHLRRTMVNPAAPAPKRAAAVTLLARGETWGLRPTSEFHRLLPRGSDAGVVRHPLRLSPSQAELYERCPRAYALERRLKVGEMTSLYAQFGTLIHAVLESAEKAALERGDDRSTRSDAASALDLLFDAAEYGGSPFAESWRRRADDLLDRQYSLWPPDSGPPVALERRLELEIGDAQWLGFADRIERRKDNTLAIVDYKTTKSNVPAHKAAAESLQLGYYLAAALVDPDITALGRPEVAELWYPLKVPDRKKPSTSIETRAFDPARLGDIEERLRAVATGVRTENWTPLPGPDCERCRVRQVCPAWPEGREAFSS